MSNGRIVVPETFAHILKTYVKDVVRTQPYDLLLWSATYFRCIANDSDTPTKVRFEEIPESIRTERGLTRGYLKVLIEQIGKGYFVERKILQKKWRELCLPENDLLKFLAICGMYSWEQVHWLKLLSVLIGSICETFVSSMELVCELLTEDNEYGTNSIPFWMFKICYSFIAQLDCSLNRQIMNDKAIKSNIDPMTFSAQYFQNLVAVGWQNDSIMNPEFLKAFNIIKKAKDFQQIIQALKDYENQDKVKEDVDMNLNSKFQEKLIREIGSPWNWIYKFVTFNSSHLASYNFCECVSKLSGSEDENSIILAEPFSCFVAKMPGIGPTIAPETIDAFLTHLESRTNEDGLVYPKYFNEVNSPPMI